MPNTTPQHHFNLSQLLTAIAHVSQVLAAVTPLVVAPLAAGGVVDAQDATLATQEANVASQVLASIVPQDGQQ